MFDFLKYGLIAVLFAFSGQLAAQELYFDGGVGNASAEEEDLEGDDTYFRIGAGYKYSKSIAFEGGYWDLGEAQDGIFSASVDGLYGAVKATAEGNGSMNFFGRIGLYMWDSTLCAGGFGCEDDDGSDIFFGGGISFDAGPGTINLELHLMELDDVDVTTIGGSFSIPFGK